MGNETTQPFDIEDALENMQSSTSTGHEHSKHVAHVDKKREYVGQDHVDPDTVIGGNRLLKAIYWECSKCSEIIEYRKLRNTG